MCDPCERGHNPPLTPRGHNPQVENHRTSGCNEGVWFQHYLIKGVINLPSALAWFQMNGGGVTAGHRVDKPADSLLKGHSSMSFRISGLHAIEVVFRFQTFGPFYWCLYGPTRSPSTSFFFFFSYLNWILKNLTQKSGGRSQSLHALDPWPEGCSPALCTTDLSFLGLYELPYWAWSLLLPPYRQVDSSSRARPDWQEEQGFRSSSACLRVHDLLPWFPERNGDEEWVCLEGSGHWRCPCTAKGTRSRLFSPN